MKVGTIVALAVLACATAAGPAPAQTSSAPEGYARSVIGACNAGDAAELAAVIASARAAVPHESTPEQTAARRLPFCRATGGWDLATITSASPTQFEATYNAHNLPLLHAQISIAMNPDGKVTRDRFSVAVDFHKVPQQTEEQLATTLDRWYGGAARNDVFGGVVYFESHGHILLRKAYDSARYPGAAASGPSTRFPIASMAKMFTAVSVAQLVERGKLKYETTLAQALPTYHGAGASQITIAQLLSHTSGLGDIFTPAYDAYKGDLPTNDAYIRFFEHDPLLFKPGTSWQYSNAGFVLLAAIVERASGMPFERYVQSHIFKPAGMADTAYDPLGIARPGDAVLYRHDLRTTRLANGGLEYDDADLARPLVRFSENRLERGTGAGDAFSTIDDLAKFAHALVSGKLVRPQTERTLFAPHGASPNIAPDAYGYGFELTNRNGKTIVGHNGGTEQMAGGLRIFDNGAQVYIVYNALGAQIEPLAAATEYLQAAITSR